MFHSIDTTPNVDYFTRDEIKTMVREFKEKCETGELDRVSNHSDVLISMIVFLVGAQQLHLEREHVEHV